MTVKKERQKSRLRLKILREILNKENGDNIIGILRDYAGIHDQIDFLDVSCNSIEFSRQDVCTFSTTTADSYLGGITEINVSGILNI